MASLPHFREMAECVLNAPGFREVWEGEESPRTFFPVAEPAEAFLLAVLLERHAMEGGAGRIWIVAEQHRQQERLARELESWGVEPIFFPESEKLGHAAAAGDPEIEAEQFQAWDAFQSDSQGVLLLTRSSLGDRVGAVEAVPVLRVGEVYSPEKLVEQLEEAGFERQTQVYARGHYAVRGGIVDFFDTRGIRPVRLEWFGDEIESIREFDLETQESVKKCAQIGLHFIGAESEGVTLRERISVEDVVIEVGGDALERADVRMRRAEGEGDFLGPTPCLAEPLGAFAPGDFIAREASRTRVAEQIREWQREGWKVLLFFHTEAERVRFGEIFGEEWFSENVIEPVFGHLAQGFSIPAARLAVLSADEILGRYRDRASQRLYRRQRQAAYHQRVEEIGEIEQGDVVVHSDYGIGVYRGLQTREGGEEAVVEYAEGAKLYVPLAQVHLLSRYMGVGKKKPALHRLGDGRWKKIRSDAKRAIEDYAAKLLAIQAARAARPGHAFPADTTWQQEFEDSFLYEETPDQARAITDAKRDMEQPRSMDRLICGDVGYGKTEVAIRAAFKAVEGGKQVAVLAPTTVLAQQHYETFAQRMSDYPFQVRLLSRFVGSSAQGEALRAAGNGEADIVIGTHRLISGDVHFKNLGLVVIDEEQRFGVKHKERFKELWKRVDVLTLSATPIPRTLYLSLMGIKDMSNITTPPPQRKPVETTLAYYDERLIREVIERELQRGGQVYYLHNRVQSIEMVRRKIAQLCPRARLAVGHGQMPAGELSEIMHRFVEGEVDVLICTTIIESGLDIPNANTIVIDRADRFGLADLYQLRGRVGRSQEKAYALLLLPRVVTGEARKRLQAIHQYQALGSGFKIAMQDLEIRGAGNLLGTAQSGHIAKIGFDLYCQLLKHSVAKLQGRPLPAPQIEVGLRLDFLELHEGAVSEKGDSAPAYLPSAFLPDSGLRMRCYRQLAEATTLKELRRLRRNWRDRFGAFPEAVENLLLVGELKCVAAAVNVSSVAIEGNRLMLTRGGDYLLVNGKFPRLKEGVPGKKLREALSLLKSLSS